MSAGLMDHVACMQNFMHTFSHATKGIGMHKYTFISYNIRAICMAAWDKLLRKFVSAPIQSGTVHV